MKKKNLMRKTIPYFTGANLIIALVLLNIVAGFMPQVKLDLTKEKVHTLSPATRSILKDVDDLVNISVYKSKDLPPEVKPLTADLDNILNEFKRINPQKIKVKYLDPSSDEAIKTEAQKEGIQPLQFSSLKSDKLEVSSGFLGIVIGYGGKKEVLPVAGDVGNLEYFLISRLKKLTRNEIPSLIFIDEKPQESQIFKRFLENNYKLESLTLESQDLEKSKSPAMIMVGRSTKLSDKETESINKWIKSGKSLIVFLDKVKINQGMQAEKIEETGLGDILKENGIEVENKLIVDGSSSFASFRTQSGSFSIQYPYWPQIRPENFNREIPAVSGVNSVMLTWASPIKIESGVKPLFSSSEKTYTDSDMSDISPLSEYLKRTDVQMEKYVLGAVKTGDVKLSVIGDSDFIRDQNVTNNQQNLILALNLVDYFSTENDLLTIRGKSIKVAPLKFTDDKTKQTIRIVNIGLPLVLLATSALISKWTRNKRNKQWYA